MSAKIEVIDTSMSPLLAMPFNLARTMQIDSAQERIGPINFGTYPGSQKFEKQSNRAEIVVMVKNRIMVTIKVESAGNESPAIGLAQQVNYPLLDKLVGG